MSFQRGLALAVLVAACGGGGSLDAGYDAGRDAGRPDAGPPDAGPRDAGPPDAGHCGDQLTQPQEQCDDGNTFGGDGCAADCRAVEVGFSCDAGSCRDLVACGDSRVERDERCDDGNRDAGDGCSGQCALESGWRCPVPGRPCVAARCSDGLVRGKEDCDDGNVSDGDGCDATCHVEVGYACPAAGGPCSNALCGDLARHPTESCDDGNDDFDDGCTPICTSEPDCTSGACFSRCGDRVFQPDAGEQCDDGDLRSGDGCSATCTIEPGFTCSLAAPSALTLPVVFRDFHATHPDFETFTGDDPAIVLPTIGANGKPAYAYVDGGRSPTTTGLQSFAQWYRTVANVNLPVRRQLALTGLRDGGSGLDFGSTAFFPLDGIAFGNEGFPNNFHFTTETRFWFVFKGTERMHFEGDDDVFIFVNGHLVVNLGGVHAARVRDVVFDSATAAGLGVSIGGLYEVALFHAERHSVGSTFHLTLTGFDFELSHCVRTCGDGVVDRHEECDDGANDGGYACCGPQCTYDQWCGDGVVQAGDEQCDDAVNDMLYGDAGGCTPACTRPHFCGDRLVDSRFSEECDDGNAVAGDGCLLCRIEH